MCEICSKLITKIPERRHWRRSGVFIVNFEQISLFPLLTLNKYMPATIPVSKFLFTKKIVQTRKNVFKRRQNTVDKWMVKLSIKIQDSWAEYFAACIKS